ncbi:MAG: hypothetical protein L6U99_15070 [Clostridium sp.]|nr:MAG: hypothetical protein L6U99_15070 [Clostridium sp.]
MIKITKIREVRPDIAITTDVIVGFPYETDEDFNETKEFIKKVNFFQVFMYFLIQKKKRNKRLMICLRLRIA